MYNSACPIQGVTCRPPRVRYNSFLPMYTATFITVCSGQYWTSGCLAPSSTYRDLICDFFSSGRGFARFRISVSSENIRLPSDSISRWTPLPSANASYCQVRSGLSPPSCYPCQVHQTKPKNDLFGFLIVYTEFTALNVIVECAFLMPFPEFQTHVNRQYHHACGKAWWTSNHLG